MYRTCVNSWKSPSQLLMPSTCNSVHPGRQDHSNCPMTSTIEMWYLHAPDRTTPFEDTMRAVNELHKEGKFKRFGISNYAA